MEENNRTAELEKNLKEMEK